VEKPFEEMVKFLIINDESKVFENLNDENLFLMNE
jgi:hypothetical protein